MLPCPLIDPTHIFEVTLKLLRPSKKACVGHMLVLDEHIEVCIDQCLFLEVLLFNERTCLQVVQPDSFELIVAVVELILENIEELDDLVVLK